MNRISIFKNHILSGDFGKLAHFVKTRIGSYLFDWPQGINIEPTETCNLHCPFCQYRINAKERFKYISFENYKKIIDDVAPFISYMGLFYRGEPLLHEDIFSMIKYASDKNLRTEISTNAVLLTKQKSRQLIDSGLDVITVSFDGATKKTYEAMRAGAKFEQVIANIKHLSKLKNKLNSRKPYVILQMIITKETEKEIDRFKQIGKEVNADEIFLRPLTPNFAFTGKKPKIVLEKFLPKRRANKLELDIQNPQKKTKSKCYSLKTAMLFRDGTVVMCCFDGAGKYMMGNAIAADFMKIWYSDKYRKFRAKQMKNMELDICAGCKANF